MKRCYIAVAPDAYAEAKSKFPPGTDLRIKADLEPGMFQLRKKWWRRWF